MTLPLYGTASLNAGFGSDKARSVVRLRAVESETERQAADFALVKTAGQLERAIEANWQSIFVVSDGSIRSMSTESFGRQIVVPAKYDYLGDGDVLGIDHSSGKFRTLFRRNSAYNSFLVTERCNNYCLMCSQPPKDVDDRWILAEIRESLALVDPTTRALTFTGGETLSDWVEFIDVLKECRQLLPTTAVQVLTNGRAFAISRIVDAWRDIGHPNLMAAIPVYASTDSVHDYVVQAKGAFDETILGILKLKDRGQRVEIRVVLAAAVVSSIFISTGAFAKTAKDCKAEWQADKAGMQSRGVTQKAYIEQCKGGAEPTAAAPSAKPMEALAPAPAEATTSGSKTAKDCKAEWQADKAGMKARGVTQRAYVEQCRGGSAPVVAAPQAAPSAPAPVPAPSQTGTSTSQKTAKECVAEWRADKAGMQARGVTQKAYVEQCRAGDAAPSAAAPEPKPTVAAPAPAPAHSRAAPAATESAPAPAPQRSAPTSTVAPTQSPVQQTSAPRSAATLEAGQFADEASAKARCPADTVVWVNLPSKIYHFAGTKSYGTTKRGAYMCEKEAISAEDRASKTEQHP
jgi:hypothetical protein